MVADLVSLGRNIVDVGTDHGFLPAFLLLSGICPSGIASDVAPLPLKNAEKTVEKYQLQDRLSLILSNGLESIPKERAEEIVIAGMGGTLMSELLGAVEWLREPDRHLVLQPMTKGEEVRQFLCENGFYIEKEEAVFEGHRGYFAISAYWDGREVEHPLGYYHFGELAKTKSPAAKRIMKIRADSLKKRRAGLIHSKSDTEEIRALDKILAYFEEL